MSDESLGNPSREPAETENQNKKEDDEAVRSELWQDVPEWLQDFKENLATSSHELPMEPRAKVEPGAGRHSVYTHLPKGPRLRHLLNVENNEGFLL